MYENSDNEIDLVMVGKQTQERRLLQLNAILDVMQAIGMNKEEVADVCINIMSIIGDKMGYSLLDMKTLYEKALEKYYYAVSSRKNPPSSK